MLWDRRAGVALGGLLWLGLVALVWVWGCVGVWVGVWVGVGVWGGVWVCGWVRMDGCEF